MKFNINDKDEMQFEEQETYVWKVNLKNNYVEAVYLEEKFNNEYKELKESLDFKEIKF